MSSVQDGPHTHTHTHTHTHLGKKGPALTQTYFESKETPGMGQNSPEKKKK